MTNASASPRMRVIPVLDVMQGVVVRGVAGRRSEYRPISSRLVKSTAPLDVARVLIDHIQPREIYLADLDAIQRTAEPALEMYQRLASLGPEVWVDAGCTTPEAAGQIARAGCYVVAGLETIPGPETLDEIVRELGPERVIFSLDLRDGVPLRTWGLASSLEIADRAIQAGIRRAIVLDLARVGLGAGTGTESLCQRLTSRLPAVDWIAGGGVSSRADLDRLAGTGMSGVLVASALHDGRLDPQDLRHS